MIGFNHLGNLGRLGNQMFQYASLKGIAKNLGFEYCVPPKEYFGKFDANCARSDVNILDCFGLYETPKQVLDYPVVEEKSFEFDKNLFDNCPDNVTLFGYFQSEKYFKHIKAEIKTDFTFKEEVRESCVEYFKDTFNEAPVISLHIRRTDYLQHSHHPVQPIEYYKSALDLLPDAPVIVFSDDTEWCKNQKLFESDRFNNSESANTAIDLCLQTLCSYHIIANSSFSWWGAWLADSKKVIAPKNWFGPPLNHDTKDLYCKDWIIL